MDFMIAVSELEGKNISEKKWEKLRDLKKEIDGNIEKPLGFQDFSWIFQSEATSSWSAKQLPNI